MRPAPRWGTVGTPCTGKGVSLGLARITPSLRCSRITAGGTTVRPGTASAAQGWRPLTPLRSSSRSTVRMCAKSSIPHLDWRSSGCRWWWWWWWWPGWISSILPDPPVNTSIRMNPGRAVWGSSVNLTCSSAANPPADNYTWYRRTDASSSAGPQVGSGQVLHIPSMEASLSGLYQCLASNRLGEKNSTEVLLAMVEEQGLCLVQFASII